MPETPLSLTLLYAFGDVVFALLAATVLVLPVAIPAGVWYLRR
jgi:hypothetical protein